MPEISRFYGIIIAIFYNEHNPPHFHARYDGEKVAVDIRTLQVLEGRIEPRALGLVIEWASQHQNELMEDWELARNEKPPKAIAPLR
jgi:phosphomannomutase